MSISFCLKYLSNNNSPKLSGKESANTPNNPLK